MRIQRRVMDAVSVRRPAACGFAPLYASSDLFAIVGCAGRAYRAADREFNDTIWTSRLHWPRSRPDRQQVGIADRGLAGSATDGARRSLHARQDRSRRCPELRERRAASTRWRAGSSGVKPRSGGRHGSAPGETAADGIITVGARGVIQSVNSKAGACSATRAMS
jgi:hypothetical protein